MHCPYAPFEHPQVPFLTQGAEGWLPVLQKQEAPPEQPQCGRHGQAAGPARSRSCRVSSGPGSAAGEAIARAARAAKTRVVARIVIGRDDLESLLFNWKLNEGIEKWT